MPKDEKVRDVVSEFISSTRSRGYSLGYIRQVLEKKGYPKDIIDSELSSAQQIQNSTGPQASRTQKIPKNLILGVSASALVLVLVITIVMIFSQGGPKECTTKECFIGKASSCSTASYQYDDEGIVFSFESYEGCKVRKSLVGLPVSEPDVIRQLMMGTEMTCTYPQGNFDARLINTLLGGLENCDGTLKDALYELAIAQFELALSAEEASLGDDMLYLEDDSLQTYTV